MTQQKLILSWYTEKENTVVGDRWYAIVQNCSEITAIEITDITELTVEYAELITHRTMNSSSYVLSTNHHRYLKSIYKPGSDQPIERENIYIIERIPK